MIKLSPDFHIIPTSEQAYQIHCNVRDYDEQFHKLSNKCSAKDCGYPLRDEDNFKLPFIGDVCNLCSVMYRLVAERAFFKAAQVEWEAEQKKRRKEIEGR